MPTAELSLRTHTAIHVSTALARSAGAVGVTVTHSTLAAAKACSRVTHRVTDIFHTYNGHHSLELTCSCASSAPSICQMCVPRTPESLRALKVPEPNYLWESHSEHSLLPKVPGTSTEDALMSLTAGIITLAQAPRALSTAAAASTLASSFPAAQGPCPIGAPAPRFQIWGGQLSLRALTESTQAAWVTAGKQKKERKVSPRVWPFLYLSFPGYSKPKVSQELR